MSLLLGTGITLMASILPAKRATRVPPIAAVREGATLPTTRMAAHSHNAGLGVTRGLARRDLRSASSPAGVSAAAVALLLGGGVLGLFAGIALLAPRLVKPLARVVGWPARRAGGVAGELAGANAVRNPGRTASTAAALMIGLTLVTVVAVLGAGFSATTRQAVSDQVRADHVIDGDQGLGFRASEGDTLASVPGVTNASHVRSDTALVQGEEGPISGIDPATIADFYTFDWTEGSERTLGQLGTDGALVTKDYAETEKLEVGGDVSLTTPSGEESTLVVRGIYDPPQAKQLLGPISMTQQGFDEAFTQPKNSYTFIDADASAAAPLEAAAKGLGDANYHVGAELPEGRHQGDGHDAGHALRAAGLLGDREPVRHGQHDGALGVRAHP